MEIFFGNDKEAFVFCEKLVQQNKRIKVDWQVSRKKENRIKVNYEPVNELFYQAVANSLVHVYITYRLRTVIREIVRDVYYFTDEHEVADIHEYAEWIVTGEDEDSKRIRKFKHPIQLIRAIFLMHLRNAETVHFDSIVQFGMKVFKEDVVDYVGFAIDEFKREEEHQALVHSVRDYVGKNETHTGLLHILEGNPFHYFTHTGRLLAKSELQSVMKKAPLYLFGFPQDEWNLAPLIALRPATIFLYVEDPSDAKIQTIIKIFEEKVQIKRKADFPFDYHVLESRKS